MARKAASGSGTIRKKTITRSGKEYTYWEARYTAGYDPGTGKQIQQSISGKTQKEVAQKLKAATASIDAGTYIAPSKLTVGEWLDTWTRDYLGGVKPGTAGIYKANVRNHIKPALGGVKLSGLRPHMVQGFVNGLSGLSVASVRLAYMTLHGALEKAVDLGYLPRNPAERCVLPKAEKKEIRPLEDSQSAALLKAAKGREIEHLVTVALFTGLRLSELLGLTWDAVDFQRGTLNISKQLARPEHRETIGMFLTPKSGKPRVIVPAASVMAALKGQRVRQMELRLRAGSLWDNPYDLVFTDPVGGPMTQSVIDHRFTALKKAAGLADFRFHDLRHTYAVNAIRAGDDIKTVQGNLGHATAAFTLDVYGHVTDQMRKESAQRMETHIKGILGS